MNVQNAELAEFILASRQQQEGAAFGMLFKALGEGQLEEVRRLLESVRKAEAAYKIENERANNQAETWKARARRTINLADRMRQLAVHLEQLLEEEGAPPPPRPVQREDGGQ